MNRGVKLEWSLTFNLSPKLMFFLLYNETQIDRKETDRKRFREDSEDFVGLLKEPWC